jgi:hypothetical protein
MGKARGRRTFESDFDVLKARVMVYSDGHGPFDVVLGGVRADKPLGLTGEVDLDLGTRAASQRLQGTRSPSDNRSRH